MTDQIGDYAAPFTPSGAMASDTPRIEISAVTDLSYAMAHCRIIPCRVTQDRPDTAGTLLGLVFASG